MTTTTLARQTIVAAVGAACLALATADASQALTFVSNRADLGANDTIDWSQLGSTSTSVANPFSATSTGGITATGSIPTNTLERRDQGNGSGWAGNFAPGDALLWTNSNPGPLSLVFSTPVSGAGTQIQANVYGLFNAVIEAFDVGGSSLGSFSVGSNSTNNGDNSAIFLGVFSNTADIKRLTFNVTDFKDFAINQVSLKTDTTSIPTPALLPGLVGLGLGVWRKRKGETAAESA